MIADGEQQWTGATPAESIDIAMMIEAIAASAKSGLPVTVAA